jgi:thymidylate synthase
VDQIQNLINDLKTNPDSRRLMVNAWNVGELDSMVLPPCHYGFQVYTRELSFDEFWDRLTPKQKGNTEKPYEGETYNGIDSRIELKNIVSKIHNLPTRAISLMWNQRSVDTFLGLPFNIASYGLLLEIIAKEVNMIPDQLIGNLGDVHLYSNHIEAAKEQIGRKYTSEERINMLKDAMSWRLYNKAVNELVPFGGGMSEYYDLHKIPNRTREPYPLPILKFSEDFLTIAEKYKGTYTSKLTGNTPDYGYYGNLNNVINSLKIDDFILDNYQSHPIIKAPLSN